MSVVFVKPFFRIKYIGKENIPKGSCIICCNHISHFDPLVLAIGINRKIYFMAKSEFFTDYGKFIRNFMKMCGVFPVNRGTADTKAVNHAEILLKNGKAVGIFPQGGIVRDINSFEPKAGAALLAVKNHIPIVSVSIYTKDKIRLFSRITVKIGKPLKLPKDNSLKAARELSKNMKERIKAQLEEKY